MNNTLLDRLRRRSHKGRYGGPCTCRECQDRLEAATQIVQLTADRDALRIQRNEALALMVEEQARVATLTADRDAALALLRRCDEWFDEGPEADNPEPLSADIKALLSRGDGV